MNYHHLLTSHRRKIIIGAPILFLILLNTSGVSGAGNIFRFSSLQSPFLSTGDAISIDLEVSTKSPVNAIGGNVVFGTEALHADAVTRTGSVIDLWSEDPVIVNSSGTIHFSGGIIEGDTDGTKGKVFSIEFRAVKPGKVKLRIEDGQLLARNGEGTNIFSGADTLTVYVRESGRPSPDINKDGVLSLSDANTLYLKTFGDYDPAYDLNGDQKLNWSDVKMLIATM